jgi:hypothetical protein
MLSSDLIPKTAMKSLIPAVLLALASTGCPGNKKDRPAAKNDQPVNQKTVKPADAPDAYGIPVGVWEGRFEADGSSKGTPAKAFVQGDGTIRITLAREVVVFTVDKQGSGKGHRYSLTSTEGRKAKTEFTCQIRKAAGKGGFAGTYSSREGKGEFTFERPIGTQAVPQARRTFTSPADQNSDLVPVTLELTGRGDGKGNTQGTVRLHRPGCELSGTLEQQPGKPGFKAVLRGQGRGKAELTLNLAGFLVADTLHAFVSRTDGALDFAGRFTLDPGQGPLDPGKDTPDPGKGTTDPGRGTTDPGQARATFPCEGAWEGEAVIGDTTVPAQVLVLGDGTARLRLGDTAFGCFSLDQAGFGRGDFYEAGHAGRNPQRFDFFCRLQAREGQAGFTGNMTIRNPAGADEYSGTISLTRPVRAHGASYDRPATLPPFNRRYMSPNDMNSLNENATVDLDSQGNLNLRLHGLGEFRGQLRQPDPMKSGFTATLTAHGADLVGEQLEVSGVLLANADHTEAEMRVFVRDVTGFAFQGTFLY